jgi:hypothetical protein
MSGHWQRLRGHQGLAAAGFLLPAGFGFGVFYLWPALRGLWMSFTDFSLLRGSGEFVGIQNYQDLASDSLFWHSMQVTAWYVVLNIGSQTVLALVMAVLMDRLTRSVLVRGVLVLPWLVPQVVIGMLWLWMLDPRLGVVNFLLGQLGIPGQAFLGDPNQVVASLAGDLLRVREALARDLARDDHHARRHERLARDARPPRADLFVRRRCILTPTKRTDPRALKKVTSLWRKVGAKVELMDPEVHDRVLGVISHLPHVLVYALVNALSRTRVPGVDLKTYCAGGFKDFTRIASSRPELWRDICLMNRRVLGRSLSDYIKNLEQLKRWIEQGQGARLEREFARANEIRGQIA